MKSKGTIKILPYNPSTSITRSSLEKTQRNERFLAVVISFEGYNPKSVQQEDFKRSLLVILSHILTIEGYSKSIGYID